MLSNELRFLVETSRLNKVWREIGKVSCFFRSVFNKISQPYWSHVAEIYQISYDDDKFDFSFAKLDLLRLWHVIRCISGAFNRKVCCKMLRFSWRHNWNLIMQEFIFMGTDLVFAISNFEQKGSQDAIRIRLFGAAGFDGKLNSTKLYLNLIILLLKVPIKIIAKKEKKVF